MVFTTCLFHSSVCQHFVSVFNWVDHSIFGFENILVSATVVVERITFSHSSLFDGQVLFHMSWLYRRLPCSEVTNLLVLCDFKELFIIYTDRCHFITVIIKW